MHLQPTKRAGFLLGGCALLTAALACVACAVEQPLASDDEETPAESPETVTTTTNPQTATTTTTLCEAKAERDCRQIWYDDHKTKHCTTTTQVCGSRGLWLVCGARFQ